MRLSVVSSNAEKLKPVWLTIEFKLSAADNLVLLKIYRVTIKVGKVVSQKCSPVDTTCSVQE
ncbi:Hypothetical protein FKW44_013638 [Caligus rogercresseyi]|uniref:Uncharacterized protein n=1 Tax=Caligus rogercresseyi TaxID=217165 RepID=A0A7T8JZU7_CALRO|nr:Hypothetical protein FKW44_013638 [Caligus rogercresseyi]